MLLTRCNIEKGSTSIEDDIDCTTKFISWSDRWVTWQHILSRVSHSRDSSLKPEITWRLREPLKIGWVSHIRCSVPSNFKDWLMRWVSQHKGKHISWYLYNFFNENYGKWFIFLKHEGRSIKLNFGLIILLFLFYLLNQH